ncbi:glycoside hydrolase family 36 protein [Kribbella speibonae]|uniref:Alpha-galactosidase n=1 Tax=Kribbella speibonae TaxID=1572660 RepID=A0A4R0IXF1_9ACTN|nr:glycoside hydrolase family 36 protein [Kribbella speibonae]TCC26920.1 alpha-galactosidase [Kribbella speibonae]TCC36228.1 alpha-galactosidase [Kribbella speibonae]
MDNLLHWSTPDLTLTFVLDDGPVRVTIAPGTTDVPTQPLVEVEAVGYGRSPSSNRHVDTVLGQQLRYVRHEDTGTALRIVQEEPGTGLQVTSVFEAGAGVRAWTEASMTGDGALELTFVSSLVVALPSVDADLHSATNSWMAESRWSVRSLRSGHLADIVSDAHRHVARSRYAATSTNSWSTGERLPVGVLVEQSTPYALGWQIEHNGPWHYEIGESRRGGYLLLSGPTDQEHQWSTRINADTPFVTVPVSLVTGADRDSVFAALTRQRRAVRRRRPADDRMPVIFNDYMNTLLGDPTTEKLLPLIDAAADAGADYFCIDAGWYAEGDWWNTVGAWQPSTTRFPHGLAEVIDRIHDRGMVPGLWLEPEVIGVRSPIAEVLPDEAFLTRHGRRVSESGRYLLDLRSSAARKHLDETVDRLIADFGVGFFKFDNNTMTGPGTDKDGTSLGQGLLEHQRALLSWLDDLHARHPELLIENCASGAMRMDYAMLSRLHLQSTSDQEDPLLYAPIAAAAPAAVLPEQAGHWAYPITGTTQEAFTLALVNGVLGRLYLSGHLNRMTAAELDLVRSAVAAHRVVLEDLDTLVPTWPLGLPDWNDEWVALCLQGRDAAYLSIWHRGPGPAEITLDIAQAEITPHFPADAGDWTCTWAADGKLTVATQVPEPSARVLRLAHGAVTDVTVDPVT